MVKTLIYFGFLLLTSCKSHTSKQKPKIKYILPDTSKSWAGQMTRDVFQETRDIERQLNVASILYGTKGEEIRIWHLISLADPQHLSILSKIDTDVWILRQMSFYYKNDSIISDVTKTFLTKSIENIQLENYWSLSSQSDLMTGDKYGCVDGSDVFIELADSAKYRFMWYRCPNINAEKDSTFQRIEELQRKIAVLGEVRQ